MRDIFQWIFGPLVLVVILLFAGQIWKEYHPPYLEYQKQFKAMLVQKANPDAKSVQFNYGVRQRWIKALNRADRCETCHLGVSDPRFIDAKEPFKTHPDFMTHDFGKFGCTVCHAGQGRAVTLAAAHGPVENWNDALYHSSFIENSCPQCHGVLPTNKMPEYTHGKSLFNEDGCLGCHKVEGQKRTQVGPPLNIMGARVKTDWLFRWILAPRAYLPHTHMPDYTFSESQAANIAFFLTKDGLTQQLELTGSYENGKRIFNESRCLSCHTVGGVGGIIGPDLGKVATKLLPERLLQTITNPHKLWPETQMPIYGFTDSEALDVATFIDQEYIDFDLTDQQTAQQNTLVNKADAVAGRKLVQEYGCIGCHGKISGIKDEGEIGPDLTSIGNTHISHFEFGSVDLPPKDQTVPNWLYNKMLDPRLYKVDLKMPYFSNEPDKAIAVTTYLLSLKGELRVPNTYKHPFEQAPSTYSPQGEVGMIIDKFRCLVCHKIYGNGGTMAPELTWEGSRVQKDWLFRYMKNPSALRPLLVERMPRFKMTDAEIEALYNYFHSTLVDNRVEDLAVGEAMNMPHNQQEIIQVGSDLYYKNNCDACHTINLKGGAIAPDLTDSGKRLLTQFVEFYLHDPKAFVTQSVEPVYHFSKPEITALTAFIISHKEEK